ncbi:amidohydrolase family protein [Rhodococcus sp. NPDC003322]
MTARSASVLVTDALLIPVDPDLPEYLEDGWLLVEDGVVADLGSGTPPAVGPEVARVDAAGAIVAPGFVSSHSHLFTSGLRGVASDETLYGWAGATMGATRDATPEDIYWATLHGSLDFLGAGVTTAFDFTDSREPWSEMVDGKRSEPAPESLRPVEYILRQIDAKHDAGIRFVNATRPDSDIGTAEEIVERFRPTVEYLDRLDPRFALGAAVFGGVQWARNRDAAEHEVTLMREFGIVNQAHFLETAEALDHQLDRFSWYDEAGALGPDFIFGHFVQATDEVIARTARAGARMSWQATANGRLGSGVAPIPEILAAGIEIGLGLDDQACSDLADPWQNMRMAAYSVRAARRDARAVRIRQVLHMQTLGAARILGVDDRVGSLTPGKYADFVVVDPTAPDVGPLWNPVDAYVLACGLRNLRGVYVGGVRVGDGMRSLHPLARQAGQEIRARRHAITPFH